MGMKGMIRVLTLAAGVTLGSLHAHAQDAQSISAPLSPAPVIAESSASSHTAILQEWWALAGLLLLLAAVLRICVLQARLKRQTREQKENEGRLNTILDSVDACIYIKDTQLRYTYGNRQLCERFRRVPETLVGSDDAEYFCSPVLDHIRTTDRLVIEQGERVVREEEVPSTTGDGLDTFVSIKIPLRTADGQISALCGISTDISELRKSRAEVQRLAYYDALTNLPNRRLLQDHIEQAVEEFKKNGSVSAVLFIDLDKFKHINDERGHEVGDAVLCTVAQRLQGLVAANDIVSRLGGDEFVILLRNLGKSVETATTRAMNFAETARFALGDTITIGGYAYFTGGSLGVTLIDSARKSVTDILREADTAMYHSKERGRNRVALFKPAMHMHVTERATMLRQLVTALESNQFQLMVQPQCNKSGRTDGVELLLRWEHPTHGLILPEKFISLTEDSGMILEIGEWALRQACQLHARLAPFGCDYPISINISPTQLRHPEFNARVINILEETATPANRIILELTESVLIEDVDETARRMQALADLGFRFSIDDFGTGYSGLAYLHRLPLYELKIARTFIQDLPEKDAGTLIKLIIATARLLELRVVAEGVERHEQATFLTAVGCDSQQGYLHHRPVTIDEWVAQYQIEPADDATERDQASAPRSS